MTKGERVNGSAFMMCHPAEGIYMYILCKCNIVILPAMEDLNSERNWISYIHFAGSKSQREKNENVWSKISPEKNKDIDRCFTLLYIWVSVTLWGGLICFQYEFKCTLLFFYGKAMHFRFLYRHYNTWITLFRRQIIQKKVLKEKSSSPFFWMEVIMTQII